MRIGNGRAALLVLALAAGLAGCSDSEAVAPTASGPALSEASLTTLAAEVRALTAGRGIGPLGRPAPVRPALVELGRALAFDKILSGNKDISCMTCHLPGFATGDGRSLSIGQGATGLGPARVDPHGAFIPRNAPPAFNLFATKALFWDGRVEVLPNGKLRTPAGVKLNPHMASAFEFGAASALPLFPVLSREEMRAPNGNELADIKDKDPQQVWKALMKRLGAIPEYRRMFEAAYPGTRFSQMNFGHAANAIAGFLVDQFAFNNSPWDQFLEGNDAAMTETQLRGAKDFMSARCSICHNGSTLSDGKFHNVAVAQIGPGKGDGPSGTDDFGRMRETGLATDRYAFRTPALRNVELTGPYGHDGAFTDLRAFVDHYSESDVKLRSFGISALEPLLQPTLQPTADAILASRDTLLNGVVFPTQTIDEVTAFMLALTDPAARDLSHAVPASVPSGLPIDH
ncbi:MAG TPA: cytochrome c peroxidase [Gemmatimonadales bacterium]|nr:cytochrome c peroxidase [Gemmatimonadales bacterium]